MQRGRGKVVGEERLVCMANCMINAGLGCRPMKAEHRASFLYKHYVNGLNQPRIGHLMKNLHASLV